MPNEIETKFDSVLANVAKAQEAAKKNNSDNKEEIKKLSDDAAKCMQELQELKLKQAKSEEDNSNLIKSLARASGGDADENNEKQYKKEFLSYIKNRSSISAEESQKIHAKMIDQYLPNIEDHSREYILKTMSAGVNPEGGYWIRPEVSNKISQRLFETSAIRSIANIETSTSDLFEIPLDDDEAASGGWVGEKETRAETDTPEIGLISIPSHEQFAMPKLTQKLIDDAGFDVEGWIQKKILNILTREENKSTVTGDGSKKPKGFLSYPAWSSAGVYERDKIEQVNTGTSGSFGGSGDSVIKLQNALYEDYQANATFVMTRTTFSELTTLKNGVGQYLINPMLFHEGTDKVLLGRPVLFFANMPEIAGDSLSIAYGDFREGYTLVDRMGIRIIRDQYTSKGFIKLYTTKRVGGAVSNYQAIKILKFAA